MKSLDTALRGQSKPIKPWSEILRTGSKPFLQVSIPRLKKGRLQAKWSLLTGTDGPTQECLITGPYNVRYDLLEFDLYRFTIFVTSPSPLALALAFTSLFKCLIEDKVLR